MRSVGTIEHDAIPYSSQPAHSLSIIVKPVWLKDLYELVFLSVQIITYAM